MRRQLRDAEDFDGLEDVQAVTKKAKGLKLQEIEACQLDDGHEAWAVAHTREEFLLKVKGELAAVKQQLQVRIQSLTMSVDEGALKSVLFQAGLRDSTGELTDTLQTRHGCWRCRSPSDVAKLMGALEKVKSELMDHARQPKVARQRVA